MKKTLSVILAVLMLASLTVAASANGFFFGRRIIPAIGKNTLTVTQEGSLVAGAELNLWRDNPWNEEDTLVGKYATGKDGTVTATGLNAGNYYWQDGSENVKAS